MFKSVFLILCIPLFLIGFLSCKEKKKPQESTPVTETQIEFRKRHIDFGKIKEGETVSQTYYIKNTGTSRLIIKKIESGCGCSTVNYPQKPIEPQKEEKIEIIFNSSGRYGKQYKEISIFANIPQGKATLSFSADIEK